MLAGLLDVCRHSAAAADDVDCECDSTRLRPPGVTGTWPIAYCTASDAAIFYAVVIDNRVASDDSIVAHALLRRDVVGLYNL